MDMCIRPTHTRELAPCSRTGGGGGGGTPSVSVAEMMLGYAQNI